MNEKVSKEHPVYPKHIPEQHQDVNPGAEHKMTPEPIYDRDYYKGTDKLKDQVAIVTGGDSGIGRSVCILFAREGADVAIVYHEHDKDAETTKSLVEKEGRKCLLLKGDIKESSFCKKCVDQTVSKFGKLDILVNNAAYQKFEPDITKLTDEQLDFTFRTNIFSQFYFVRESLKHMKPGARIINTTSVTTFKGQPVLLDYSSTKGAILAFTRSLAKNLISKGIRVNGVAPGPIWTPFIPSSFPAEKVKDFGSQTSMGRAGQPFECATSYVFLASEDSSYFNGQVLHPNGGSIINT